METARSRSGGRAPPSPRRLTRYAASLLYGVTPLDLASFAAGILLITVAVAVAAALPARRASRLDPIATLREGEA